MPVVLRSTFEAARAKAAEVETELRREMEALREALARARDDHESALADRDGVAASLARANAEGERFAAALEAKQAELTQAADAFAAYRREAQEALEAERASAAARLAAVRREAEQMLETHRAQFETALEGARGEAQAAIEQGRSALVSTQARLQEEAAAREAAELALSDARVQLAQTSRRLADFRAETERLGAQVQEMQAVHRAHMDELARGAAERERVTDKLKDFEAETQRLGQQVVHVMEENRTLAATTVPASALALLQQQHAALKPLEAQREFLQALRRSGARQRLAAALTSDVDGNAVRNVVFALHKTASSYVAQLFDYLAEMLNVPIYSPNGTGAEYINDEVSIRDAEVDLEPLRGLFGAFRGPIPYDPRLFWRIVLLLRDPRDILTSLYYSWTFSHPIEPGRRNLVNSDGELFNPNDEQRRQWAEEGPDPFVLEYAAFVERTLRVYLEELAPLPQARIVHYEDFVEDPLGWTAQLLVQLGAEPTDVEYLLPGVAARFAEQFAPIKAEDKMKHIRQKAPGDHVRKLKPETIQALTQRFQFYFNATGRAP